MKIMENGIQNEIHKVHSAGFEPTCWRIKQMKIKNARARNRAHASKVNEKINWNLKKCMARNRTSALKDQALIETQCFKGKGKSNGILKTARRRFVLAPGRIISAWSQTLRSEPDVRTSGSGRLLRWTRIKKFQKLTKMVPFERSFILHLKNHIHPF